MEERIARRAIDEAIMMTSTGKTLRQIALLFGVSKSTVHKDLKERLIKIDRDLFLSVDRILKYHIEIRHINGGEATKKKYLNLIK